MNTSEHPWPSGHRRSWRSTHRRRYARSPSSSFQTEICNLDPVLLGVAPNPTSLETDLCLYFCLSVYLSTYPSTLYLTDFRYSHLAAHLYVQLSGFVFIYQGIHVSLPISICLSFILSFDVSINVYLCLSIYLLICQFCFLPVYLSSIYLSMCLLFVSIELSKNRPIFVSICGAAFWLTFWLRMELKPFHRVGTLLQTRPCFVSGQQSKGKSISTHQPKPNTWPPLNPAQPT